MTITTSPILPEDLVECASLHLEAFANDEYTSVIRPMRLRDSSTPHQERCEGLAAGMLYELQGGRRTIARKAVDDETGCIIGRIFWIESNRPGVPKDAAVKPPTHKAFKSTEIDQEASAAFTQGLDEQVAKLHLKGHVWSINRLATRPGFEKRGVASQLLQETMKEIQSLGDGVPLFTVSSYKAEKLYHAHGFETLARVEIKIVSKSEDDASSHASWPLVVKRPSKN